MAEAPLRVDEEAWQRRWSDANAFVAPNEGDRPTFYCLEMYPYPSGKMHMGHLSLIHISEPTRPY